MTIEAKLNTNHKYKVITTAFSKCYILECNGGYLLIDTGYPKDYEKFIKKLDEKYHIDVSEIKYLLLTHHHDDHSGFAAELIKNTDLKLIIHEKSIERLKMGQSEEESQPINKRIKFIFGFFNYFHEFVFPPIIPRENDIIMKGTEQNTEILKNIGINGTIIYTQGHTMDGISVMLDDGSIFVGDNAMNAWYFNMWGIKKRPIFVQDIGLIFGSWETYIKMGGKKIYPIHGKPFNIEKLKKSLLKFKNNKDN